MPIHLYVFNLCKNLSLVKVTQLRQEFTGLYNSMNKSVIPLGKQIDKHFESRQYRKPNKDEYLLGEHLLHDGYMTKRESQFCFEVPKYLLPV